MDIEVAVEKLSSLRKDEIYGMAKDLPVTHYPEDSAQCIIANVLRDMTGEVLSVSFDSVHWGLGEENLLENRTMLPLHVQELIQEFDERAETL